MKNVNKDHNAIAVGLPFALVGLLVTVMIVLFSIDPTVLIEQAKVISASDTATLGVQIDFGWFAYFTSSFFWLIFLVIVGLPWSLVFFRRRTRTQKFLLAAVCGLIAIELSVLLAGVVISLLHITGSPAALATEWMDKFLVVFAGNQEQAYGLLSGLILFVAGVMVLIAKEAVTAGRQKPS